MSSEKGEDIPCERCGKPLTGSSVIIAYRDNFLGARIVIHCGNCGYSNRFKLQDEKG